MLVKGTGGDLSHVLDPVAYALWYMGELDDSPSEQLIAMLPQGVYEALPELDRIEAKIRVRGGSWGGFAIFPENPGNSIEVETGITLLARPGGPTATAPIQLLFDEQFPIKRSTAAWILVVLIGVADPPDGLRAPAATGPPKSKIGPDDLQSPVLEPQSQAIMEVSVALDALLEEIVDVSEQGDLSPVARTLMWTVHDLAGRLQEQAAKAIADGTWPPGSYEIIHPLENAGRRLQRHGNTLEIGLTISSIITNLAAIFAG